MVAPNALLTARLLLRPFEPGDVEHALAYRDDPEFARFLPHIPQPFTKKDAEAFVALNTSEPWDRSPTVAIVFEGTVIGTVNFDVDTDDRSAMLGYALGRAWWRRGLATVAAAAAMEWAVTTFDLLRVWAATDSRNVRSIRVMKKLGLAFESRQVAMQPGRVGERVEEVVWGISFPPGTLG